MSHLVKVNHRDIRIMSEQKRETTHPTNKSLIPIKQDYGGYKDDSPNLATNYSHSLRIKFDGERQNDRRKGEKRREI